MALRRTFAPSTILMLRYQVRLGAARASWACASRIDPPYDPTRSRHQGLRRRRRGGVERVDARGRGPDVARRVGYADGERVDPVRLGEQGFIKLVRHAYDRGISYFDTADQYAHGRSEEIVGRALRGRRDQVVLATKFHNPMGRGINDRGNSRLWVTRAIEGSLRRLQTDHVDLYQAHRPDTSVDLEETLDAGLPHIYDKPLYEQKCSALFEHIYESYPERDAGVYAGAV